MKKNCQKQHHQLAETAEMKIRHPIVLLVDIAVRVLEIMIVIITIGLLDCYSGDCLNRESLQWKVFREEWLFSSKLEKKEFRGGFKNALLAPSLPKYKMDIPDKFFWVQSYLITQWQWGISLSKRNGFVSSFLSFPPGLKKSNSLI